MNTGPRGKLSAGAQALWRTPLPENLSSLRCAGCRTATRPPLRPSGSVLRDGASEKASRLPCEGRQAEAPGMNSLGGTSRIQGLLSSRPQLSRIRGMPSSSFTYKEKRRQIHTLGQPGGVGATGGPRLLFYVLTHSCNNTVSAITRNASISPEMFKKRHANKK